MRVLTSGRVGGWSLIVGAIAFAAFWGSTLLGREDPLAVSLGIHALSILLISVGLINVQEASDAASPLNWLGWVGVTATVLGLMMLLPLLAVGLVLVGLVSWLARRWVGSGVALIVGATALLAGYLPRDGRIGTEGAPAPRLEIRLVLATALVLISVGLVLTGYRRLRWVPDTSMRDAVNRGANPSGLG
jgi:hypothetical protein